MILNPFGCVNDGVSDFGWLCAENRMNFGGVVKILDSAKTKGAIHVYDGSFKIMRAKQAKF